MNSVGIVGLRGVYVVYSGFETFVAELIKRSTDKYQYYLYVRQSYQKKQVHKANIKLIPIVTIVQKYLETLIYGLSTAIHCVRDNVSIVLCLGVVYSPIFLINKLLGKQVIINVDGLDWQRKRWNILGKLYLRFCEVLAVLYADFIICDSKTVYAYYVNELGRKNNIKYIPYGINQALSNNQRSYKILSKFGLCKGKYIHVVGRLTPENGIEDIIKAFRMTSLTVKCVIVGDAYFENQYKSYLQQLKKQDQRIVFTGFLEYTDYSKICQHSMLYVETKRVGGTHPSLLEAVGFNNKIIANNLSYHREVLENYALYYSSVAELAKQIEAVVAGEKLVKTRIKNNQRKKILARYNWNHVIKDYESLFGRFL